MDKDVHRMDRDALITEVKRLRAGIRSTDGNVSPLTKTAMALAALAIGLGNPRLVQFEFVKLQPTSASQLDAVASRHKAHFFGREPKTAIECLPCLGAAKHQKATAGAGHLIGFVPLRVSRRHPDESRHRANRGFERRELRM